MDRAYLQARIDATKNQIEAYEKAALFFAENSAAQSYTLDTGQSRQTVMRADPKSMQNIIDQLYNRCATLETRLNGSGTTHVRPCW